ncbi:hypothetical protein ACERIT_12225 [Halopenitus sp. H-Gu1]|uniref:hypothetical protein n=1 Tax=Halopenitus sp. H-Gu1 TaxID=3242697 RepID=UPI00359D09AB
MPAVSIGLFVLVLLLAVVAPFVLYYFVRAEQTQRATMDREAAEQAARQDLQDRDER